MHVLQLHTRYRQAGGEDVAVDAEARLLRAAGHEVTTVQAQNPSAAIPSAVSLLRSPWNSSSARIAAQAIRTASPDVVHVHNTWYAMSPSVISAAAGNAPVVMTLHNYRLTCSNALLFRDGRPCEECVGSHPWQAVRHACYRGSRLQSIPAAATISVSARRGTWHRDVERFLALTPFAKKRFEAAGLPSKRILIRPHTVPDPGPRAAPPSRSRDLLAVGRLSGEKGYDIVIEAMARLDDSGLRLVIIGDGPDREELERSAGGRVKFTGRISASEVQDWLKRSRALVFPSLAYETFGITLIEAMAAGLPVVVSDRGGSGWIVGEAGRLVPPGDALAWSAALRVLASDDLVDRCGELARRRWHERYRPEVGLDGLEDAYTQAIEDRRERCLE